MSGLRYLCCILLCSGVLSVPILEEQDFGEGELTRSIRSPTLFKKRPLLGALLGGLHGGDGHHEGSYGTHITNINNYGPHGSSNHGHGQGSGSFAGSFAGGHGPSQSQSQSASFALGPYSASFSQSQSHSGGGSTGGIFDHFDY
nr:glycine-rich cell wall structural protein 1.8-like [Leptinotarsa decemlineata]